MAFKDSKFFDNDFFKNKFFSHPFFSGLPQGKHFVPTPKKKRKKKCEQ